MDEKYLTDEEIGALIAQTPYPCGDECEHCKELRLIANAATEKALRGGE